MSKLRKEGNFTIVSNSVINDEKLCFKSKGIYAYLCSKPDGWDFYINEIASRSSEGVKSIRSGLKKLEDCGYLVRTKVHGECGRFTYDYEIFESPEAISPHTPKGHAVEATVVKGTPNNTNRLSNTYKNKERERKHASLPKNEIVRNLFEEVLLDNKFITGLNDFCKPALELPPKRGNKPFDLPKELKSIERWLIRSKFHKDDIHDKEWLWYFITNVSNGGISLAVDKYLDRNRG